MPKRRWFTNDDECAFVRVHRTLLLGMGWMRKTYKICLRVFDWRFPMEKMPRTHIHVIHEHGYMLSLWCGDSLSATISNKKIGLESHQTNHSHSRKMHLRWNVSVRNVFLFHVRNWCSRANQTTCSSICLEFCRVYLAHLSCGVVYMHSAVS